MGLISDRALQAARIAEKRNLILTWLKTESFSSVQIIAEVMGTQQNAAYKTLKTMERDGLVTFQRLENIFGALTIWGITAHGSALAVDPYAAKADWTHFEPGRLSPLTIAHHLDVQRARLYYRAAGWTHWQSDRQCHQLQLAKVPDAIAVDSDGQGVAIEVERTIKTIKRYEMIISYYLQAIHVGQLDRVQYVCPTPGVAARLARLFSDIDAVPVKGERILLTDIHRSKFSFKDFSTKEAA